jgi:hypothetical protein
MNRKTIASSLILLTSLAAVMGALAMTQTLATATQTPPQQLPNDISYNQGFK